MPRKKPISKESPRLCKITIERHGETWTVIRERASNGETFGGSRDLEEAFSCVRAAYDKHGHPLEGA